MAESKYTKARHKAIVAGFREGMYPATVARLVKLHPSNALQVA